MEVQWDDLRVFLAVARHESLSGAGRVLNNDPATVGRRIARLEEKGVDFAVKKEMDGRTFQAIFMGADELAISLIRFADAARERLEDEVRKGLGRLFGR